MTEQAADAAVDQACRALRLPTMRTRFIEVADAAEREQLTYRGFLAELLMAECDDQDRRRSALRITAAGFPREKWLQVLPTQSARCGGQVQVGLEEMLKAVGEEVERYVHRRLG
jgi:hypothetical protein